MATICIITNLLLHTDIKNTSGSLIKCCCSLSNGKTLSGMNGFYTFAWIIVGLFPFSPHMVLLWLPYVFYGICLGMERKLDDVGPKSFNREMTFDSGSILGIVSLFKKPWWAFPTNTFLSPIIIFTHFFWGGGSSIWFWFIHRSSHQKEIPELGWFCCPRQKLETHSQ